MNQRFSITPATSATDTNLTDSEYRTLAVIGIYGDKNGWCWPSQSTLAEQRGVSRKTINVHIKRLIDLGYLNISPRYDEETGAQKSNMMQIKFDYAPNVTGGVTSKTLQGVSPIEGYRGGEVQEVTHNALVNAPVEQIISPLISAYENTFGPITYKAQQILFDDDQTYGTAKVIEAINIAKERGAKSYAYTAKVLEGKATETAAKQSGKALWEEVERYQQHAVPFSELSPIAQTAVRGIGGESVLRSVQLGYQSDQLKKQVMSYAQ